MPADREARVSATPPVLDLLERLAARYGPLVIHQSGGCCDGSSPICLPAEELPAGPHDVLLGVVGDTPVYVDREQDERWQSPTLQIGLAPGPAMGFSLESVEDVHLLASSGERRYEPQHLPRQGAHREEAALAQRSVGACFTTVDRVVHPEAVAPARR